MFFTATDGGSGRELWATQGEASTTFRVIDINMGAGGSTPRNFIGSQNVLLFSADDGVLGRELFKSDGTGGW